MAAIEKIYLEDDFNPVVKLEPITELDFSDGTPSDEREKIGEIFRITQNHLKFVCVHCSEEFPLFAQFAVHIEQHLQIYANSIKTVPLSNNERPAIDVDVKPLVINDVIAVNCETVDGGAIENHSRTDTSYRSDISRRQTKTIHIHNDTINLLKCSGCDRYFKTMALLKRHEITHSNDKPHGCHICDRKFNQSYNLYRHVRLMHKTEPPTSISPANHAETVIEVAEQKKTDDNNATDWQMPDEHAEHIHIPPVVVLTEGEPHMIVDLPKPTSYECFECHTTYVRQQECRKHIRTHNPQLQCLYCGNAYGSAQALSCHHSRCKPTNQFKCKECYRTFYGVHLLSKHTFYVHGDGKNLKPWRRFSLRTCPVCKEQFTDLPYFQRHLRQHKRETNIREHKCDMCGVAFLEKSTLTQHLARHMAREQGKKDFTCKICNKSFVKDYGRKHMRIHETERNFQCAQCGLQFKTVEYLKRHTLIHSGERMYKCKYCTKSYMTSDKLLKHHRTHTGEFIYNCKWCGKGFSEKRGMKKHTMSIHGQQWDSPHVKEPANLNSEQMDIAPNNA